MHEGSIILDTDIVSVPTEELRELLNNITK